MYVALGCKLMVEAFAARWQKQVYVPVVRYVYAVYQNIFWKQRRRICWWTGCCSSAAMAGAA